MKYKVGDKVKLKSKEGLDEIERQLKGMALNPEVYDFAGAECTICNIVDGGYIFDVFPWGLSENMIEGLVEDDVNFDVVVKESTKDISDKVVDTLMGGLMVGKSFNLPQGYIFKDENGNVINATKIILEKKKKEYPKTYEECCKVIGFCSDTLKWNNPFHINRDTHPYIKHLDNLMESICKLRICRDAYWKIAGEEMGLGKPWEPDWSDTSIKYCLERDFDAIDKNVSNHKGHTFAFPTEEMRDAFKENFDPDIEICKEFL